MLKEKKIVAQLTNLRRLFFLSIFYPSFLVADQAAPSFFPSYGCFTESKQTYESTHGKFSDPILAEIWKRGTETEEAFHSTYTQQARMAVQVIQNFSLAHGSYIQQPPEKPEEASATSLDESEEYSPEEASQNTRNRQIYFPKGIDLYSEEEGRENFKRLAEAICQSTNSANPFFPASLCAQSLIDRTNFTRSFVQDSISPISQEVALKPNEIGENSTKRAQELQRALSSSALADNQFRHGFQTSAASIQRSIARQCGNSRRANGYVYNQQGLPVGFFVRVSQGSARPIAMFQPLVGAGQYASSYKYLIRADDSERQAFHRRAERVYGLSSGSLDCQI